MKRGSRIKKLFPNERNEVQGKRSAVEGSRNMGSWFKKRGSE